MAHHVTAGADEIGLSVVEQREIHFGGSGAALGVDDQARRGGGHAVGTHNQIAGIVGADARAIGAVKFAIHLSMRSESQHGVGFAVVGVEQSIHQGSLHGSVVGTIFGIAMGKIFG